TSSFPETGVSYTVLARKWRPRRFEELVGQPHVVQALHNSLADNRLHHAYLFTGTRGIGKTTVARLLAKALNCETGIVAEPCGVCTACTAIDEGRFVDLIEVDAASRTKVDDTRELLDNVQYAPTRGRFKVYLIDEVHMLSKWSFNALLKTLEEPPPHVKFLLATTDPQQLPVTVLSRCLQFNLKRFTVAQIQAQLEKICRAEGIAFDATGLKAIARAAAGSMRDGLSLLDQSIAFGGGKVEGPLVAAMLGSIDRGHVLRLLAALAKQDGAALLAEVAKLDESAPDYGAVLDELLEALQRIAVLQLVGGRSDDEELAAVAPFVEQFSAEDAQLYYQIALHGRRDLPFCREPRMGFEMTLLRMLAFRPVAEAGAAPGRPVRVAAAAAPEGPRGAQTSAATRPQSSSAADRSAETSARPNGVAAPAADWATVVQSLDLRGPTRQLADNCDLKSNAGGAWQLVLPADKEHLNTQQLRTRLEAALREQYGRDSKLSIVVGQPSRPTPADTRRANESTRMREAREAIENDANVKAIQAAFDATLEADSIRSSK
ncbi:MAG TPA: DNA polymerase III subunit gamma/tau, partial [Gammaproteobacteria bacterium]|nr:DNA polymerase III subunit gamma/tau [Gammaproteobacteria bacterium]